MKRYNTDKRATYKRYTRKTYEHYDDCDGHDTHKKIDHIHITPTYDGCNGTIYTADKIIRSHTYKDQAYVDIPNAIYDIFPEISGNENHIYKGTAPYKKFIPTQPTIPYTAPEDMEYAGKEKVEHKIYTNTKRAKCIIYNDKGEIIYYGIFKRTQRTDEKGTHTTLYRGDRSIDVKSYIPQTDDIHGVDIKNIYRNDVEIYKI